MLLRGFVPRLPSLEVGDIGVCIVGPRNGRFAAAELMFGKAGLGGLREDV